MLTAARGASLSPARAPAVLPEHRGHGGATAKHGLESRGVSSKWVRGAGCVSGDRRVQGEARPALVPGEHPSRQASSPERCRLPGLARRVWALPSRANGSMEFRVPSQRSPSSSARSPFFSPLFLQNQASSRRVQSARQCLRSTTLCFNISSLNSKITWYDPNLVPITPHRPK